MYQVSFFIIANSEMTELVPDIDFQPTNIELTFNKNNLPKYWLFFASG